ncbi:hypothetical protein BGX31_011495 [Mortierella sp. GBA43]|nr:hypothetical protein BGX31_011495 [Mortierella sp. GBA43]
MSQPIQEFRCRSTGDVLEIATHLDPKSGERIILWDDIQAGFDNAKSIRNGRSLVSFLRDEDLKEIMPRRILYHPGTVLDVIVDDYCGQGQDPRQSYRRSLSPSQLDPAACPVGVTPEVVSQESRHNNEPRIQPTVRWSTDTIVALADIDTNNTSLTVHPVGTEEESSSSPTISDALQRPSLHDVLSTQVSIQTNPRGYQEQTAQSERRNSRLLRNQKGRKKMYRVSLDRLAVIQNRIQTLITRTYELHEYPVPRLFIILPKVTGVLDRITSPSSRQFRLHFLCECGAHTMDENSRTQHDIHLAKHEGYDLKAPAEFFERYGSYTLVLMNMIKHGVTAAGLVVPPLSSHKIIEETGTAHLVDSTIDFLESIKRENELGEEATLYHAELIQLKALEDTDLRQLESFLKVKDKGHVLANLYRIVTTEGHVKWVCFDHYSAVHQASPIRQLRVTVIANGGTYIEEIGRIEIKIASSTLAKQFYDAMIEARGVQELQVTLQWDATMSDLRLLANAITKANVVHLTLDGSHFKSSPLDVVNRSQRFNPILQLVSNSRLQVFKLTGFESFDTRISNPGLLATPKLHTFAMDLTDQVKSMEILSTVDFLGRCSTLKTLELTLCTQHSITKAISDVLSSIHNLKSLKIRRGHISIMARVTDGKIQDTDMTMQRLGSLIKELKSLHKEDITRLSITDILEDGVDELEYVLHCIPSLKHLRLGCRYERSLAFIDCVILTRENIIQDTGSSCLRTFELTKQGLISFSALTYDVDHHIEAHISFQDNSNSYDMRTWIRQNWGSNMAHDFVRRYGWSIVFFDGRLETNVNVLDILNGFGNTRIPQLQTLRIRSHLACTQNLDWIIHRSPNFKDLGVYVDLDSKKDFEAAKVLFSHAPLITTLFIQDGALHRWSWFVASFPTRSNLPELESFRLSLPKNFRLPPACVSWIVAMVSPPLLGCVIPSNYIDEESANKARPPWTSLKRIDLDNIQLQPGEWWSVIKAIDFSELQILSFWNSNFSLMELKLLIDCIPDNNNDIPVPLMTLDLKLTPIYDSGLIPLLQELRRKAPSVTVYPVM